MTPTAPYEGETGFNVFLSWFPTVVTRAHSDKKEKSRVQKCNAAHKT